jgi:hypothetical protein
MLPILGLLMFISYVLEGFFHRPTGSLFHLVSLIACVSFIGEFVRSRVVAFKNRERGEVADAISATNGATRSLDSELARPMKCQAAPRLSSADILAQSATSSSAARVVRC